MATPDYDTDFYAWAQVQAEALRAKFVEALRKTDVEARQGRVRFDRYQNVVSDIYISRIDQVGDQIVPVVIETIRNVDQFLGLDPADYLKKPRLVTLKGSFLK